MPPKLPSKARQEKVTLRETPMGSRVINRLALPNIDKSAELRRLIELGIACELAGFILDGETLRQAGRVWEIQPQVLESSATESIGTSPKPPAGDQPTLVAPGAAGRPNKAQAQDSVDSEPRPEPSVSPLNESPMLANLRKLSAS